MGSRRHRGPEGPIGVVGLGRVGGTVVLAFAESGLEVRCYDRDVPSHAASELSGCRVVFLCVPTPATREGFDLTEVWAALSDSEPHLADSAVVAIKSTVPPGTCDSLANRWPRLRFASVPEFLVAARPLETFVQPDRIVIGARDSFVARALSELMLHVVPAASVVVLEPAEAELVKLCSNAMLAAKVAMANELADICAGYGVSWKRVQAAVGLDRRIGPDHMTVTPERGFGGPCLPKDLDGLIGTSFAGGNEPALLQAVARFNRRIRGVPSPTGTTVSLPRRLGADSSASVGASNSRNGRH
jgi:UDPglucose 6-dehydrogenase